MKVAKIGELDFRVEKRAIKVPYRIRKVLKFKEHLATQTGPRNKKLSVRN